MCHVSTVMLCPSMAGRSSPALYTPVPDHTTSHQSSKNPLLLVFRRAGSCFNSSVILVVVLVTS